MAEPATLRRLHEVKSFQTLIARGWEAEKTLLFVPKHKPAYHAEIFVVGTMFAWDEQSPVIWQFSTIGLCTLAQAEQPDRAAFSHFELVLATNNAEKEDPFPMRLGIVLSAGAEKFPGWDWSQVQPPPLLQWLAIAGQEFASWMKDGAHFAVADILTFGPGKMPWTKSELDHSVLLPVPPHMLLVGFSPFNEASDPIETIAPENWHADPGIDRYRYGFYWLLPVSKKEHEHANVHGTWTLFADLIDLAPEGSEDDCVVTFDLLRGVR